MSKKVTDHTNFCLHPFYLKPLFLVSKIIFSKILCNQPIGNFTAFIKGPITFSSKIEMFKGKWGKWSLIVRILAAAFFKPIFFVTRIFCFVIFLKWTDRKFYGLCKRSHFPLILKGFKENEKLRKTNITPKQGIRKYTWLTSNPTIVNTVDDDTN